jgi:hypothetical protein
MVKIKEDSAVPANAVGGGNIAGIGVGPQGEPGVPKKNKLPKLRVLFPGIPGMVKRVELRVKLQNNKVK